MKKNKTAKSKDTAELAQAAGYMVGQVAGSLFPKKSSAGSGSLSALFSTASAKSLVFVPAPQPKKKITEPENKDGDGETSKKEQKKKIVKGKSAAEQKLQERECGLQNADEDDLKKISKKAKRKAKNDGETMEEDHPNKRQRTVRNMALERIKLKRTVFVGNLPVSCTKKALEVLFRDSGTIESVRFRSVVREDPTMTRKVAAIQRKVHPKRQSINAYIVFTEEEGVESALKRNGWEIENNFHIRVDRVSKNSVHDHKRSIFVGNLPYDIMELPVRQHFEDCGQVEAVRLVRDKDSGMGKGFGYVLFESADSVMLALKLDGSQLLDRKIRVKRSVKKEKVKPNSAAGKGVRGRDGKRPGKEKRGNTKGVKGAASKQGSDPRTQGKPFKKNFKGKGQKASNVFKGEMTDPNVKKGKGLKKKFKPRKKAVHI